MIKRIILALVLLAGSSIILSPSHLNQREWTPPPPDRTSCMCFTGVPCVDPKGM